MAYFLKRSNNKKGIYLQIYESFYDPERKQTVHKAIKPIGYVHELIDSGIEDPVSYYKEVISDMNEKKRSEKEGERIRRIGKVSPEKYLGYFPFAALDSLLGIAKDMSYMDLSSPFRFSLYDLLSSLVFARMVCPCSKSKTFHDVLPSLGKDISFSLDQLYDGLGYIGSEYEKIIEIYNHRIESVFGRDESVSYFDCTNFYFEIDSEDDLRRKGPSKENRHDPIVGLGLLLDANLIPIGMQIYPGNESEKPVLGSCLDSLKSRNNVQGRIVRVADKGLNCANNIFQALKEGDGYLFSKSVKKLPEAEQKWILEDNGWDDTFDKEGRLLYSTKSIVDVFSYTITDDTGKKKTIDIEEKRVVSFNPRLAKKHRAEIDRMVDKARGLRLSQAKKSEYGEAAKFVTFEAIDDAGEIQEDRIVTSLNHEAIEKAKALAGYNMLVTSETHMSDSEIYDTYHRLWRIEESFKVMKTQLEARPVYLRKEETIKGHFLICYISVLLLRLLQFKVLKESYSSEQVMEFTRGFKVVEISPDKYINISKGTLFLKELEKITRLPLSNYYLKKSQISKILDYRFKRDALGAL